MSLTYAQKSFSPFLKSRRRAAWRRAGLSLMEPQETATSRRLLEVLVREGPTRVSTLLHRSEMGPIPFAATLQSLKKAGLISIKGTKGGQLISLTALGQEMTAE